MRLSRNRLRGGAIGTGASAWLLASLLLIVSMLGPHAAWASGPTQLTGALQRDDIGIIAHRGASAIAPENTLAAFRLALEQGADFIETDVQLTADGVPVLMHDPDLDRTTNGSGALSAHRLEQLRALDAGAWFSAEFAGERVPTLEEFIELLAPAGASAFVELKGDWPEHRVGETVAMLREHRLAQRVVLASFERETLEAVRRLAPEFAAILLTRELGADTVDYAIGLQVSAVCARGKLLVASPRQLRQLREAGIGAIAYTLNTPGEWSLAAAIGVDFVVTDDAEALAAWRRSRAA